MQFNCLCGCRTLRLRAVGRERDHCSCKSCGGGQPCQGRALGFQGKTSGGDQKGVTLEAGAKELNEKVGVIRAQLEGATFKVGTLKLEVTGIQAEMEGLRLSEETMATNLKNKAFLDAKF